jgi:E3 ubiquitin-protein ligase ZNF598
MNVNLTFFSFLFLHAGNRRHTAFLARVSSIANNPNHAIPAVKAAVRSYRANESAARDLISTVWTISDRNLEGTASIVNGLVDLLDDEEKKRDLLQAWNGFKIEVPSLPSVLPH